MPNSVQVASTLLEAGLWTQDDWANEREMIITALQDCRKNAGGLVGFGKLLSNPAAS